MVVVGGVYDDERAAMKRLMEIIDSSDWLRGRLAIENDEMFHTAAEIVEIAEKIRVPARLGGFPVGILVEIKKKEKAVEKLLNEVFFIVQPMSLTTLSLARAAK